MQTDFLANVDIASALIPYVSDRNAVTDATELISNFGDAAGIEAAIRANKSRSLGNAIHFCRWRQIERLIPIMTAKEAIGTVH